MAEEGPRIGGFSSGLAVVLNEEDKKESRRVSYCDDFGDQSIERTLEHIFDLPYKTITPLTSQIDSKTIQSIIKNNLLKHKDSIASKASSDVKRDGLLAVSTDNTLPIIGIEESSILGDIKIVKPPLLLESHALFSSVRANVCVWKGKWMYEVTLETAGVQQIGWATLSCPFTEHKGVGDSEDSYAYDGKRVNKWNIEAENYGQPWVVGDIIGCCLDLVSGEVIFYRNGVSLGVAFSGVRKIVPGLGYFPAISLSHGESCELNFGSRPFKYPVKNFLPLHAPPSELPFITNLLRSFLRLIEIQRDSISIEKSSKLKRFVSYEDIFHSVSHGICETLFSKIDFNSKTGEYITWGPLLSFIIQVFKVSPLHDYKSLDRVLDCLLKFRESKLLFHHLLDALSYECKVSNFVLSECPYTGSYLYLGLTYHILRREELMILWYNSINFEFLFEGFLSRKNPNKYDLQGLIPSVFWPGYNEDLSNENSMALTSSALSEAVKQVEEKQRELCQLVIQFIPPSSTPQLPGSIFRTFLQNILLKNWGADRNLPPPGVSNNSVLVSLFTIILHFLSEGFNITNHSIKMNKKSGFGSDNIGFLHRGGEQSFPINLFLKNDDISRLGGSYMYLKKSNPINEKEIIKWEEGFMEDEKTRVTHLTKQKPCCCANYNTDIKISKDPIRFLAKSGPTRSGSTECNKSSLNDEISDDKVGPSTSDHHQSGSGSEYSFWSMQQNRNVFKGNDFSNVALNEEELLDSMLLLYHLGVAPNFKQASLYMSKQTQSMSVLEETDKQIREKGCAEQVKRLKEARNLHRDEVMDCVRHCVWYRVSLLSRWKQRGIFGTCMWVVQLLLTLSKMDSIFVYIPEYYLETLVDCFHVLRKSDPPFVPTTVFIKQGLASFVTLVVTHFNDPRISSAELKDLLLHSISVLLQYKEYLAEFECNKAATQIMPKALLSAFDNRSWIPVTNILLRLCKGFGFCFSKHGESSSTSIIFQKLLRETCMNNEELFSAFLNRLFNTLSWTMTEFSVSIREMQEHYKVLEFQQKKGSVTYDLSCNLARILEFLTCEVPVAFLSGPDTNLRRLTELIVFILNHLNSTADLEFFDLSVKRPGQAPEKINRGMILAPLAGIMLNLLDAKDYHKIDIIDIFASMDCPNTVHFGLKYILDYNWGDSSKGDDYVTKMRQLEKFSSLLICRKKALEYEESVNICCICYASEADTRFVPCSHVSCFGCISRHLLNCQRCFFCNAKVMEVCKSDGILEEYVEE